MSPEEYNEESAERYGWSPEDFGLSESADDQDVIDAVKAFQREQGISTDGKVGPTTWGRLQTFLEYQSIADKRNHILIDGAYEEVNFPCIPAAIGSKYSLITTVRSYSFSILVSTPHGMRGEALMRAPSEFQYPTLCTQSIKTTTNRDGAHARSSQHQFTEMSRPYWGITLSSLKQQLSSHR